MQKQILTMRMHPGEREFKIVKDPEDCFYVIVVIGCFLIARGGIHSPERERKQPPVECGHPTVSFLPFLHPLEIWGHTCTQASQVFQAAGDRI